VSAAPDLREQFAIRPATDAELALVRSSWNHQMRPRFGDTEPMGSDIRGHAWGQGRYVAQATMVEMFRRHVDEHATVDGVLVGAVGGEALGWIARSVRRPGGIGKAGCIVHFVYVLGPGRRAGLGAMLLRYVRQEARTEGVEVHPGCMTSAGIGLWESEKSQ
jgi:GNAT superfamily N-acetyltransferase